MKSRNSCITAVHGISWHLYIFIGLGLSLLVSISRASAEELTYKLPPKPIADLVDVSPTPDSQLSPDRKTLLLLERPSLPGIVEVSQPELKLAGLRVNPKTNGPSRLWSYVKLYLQDLTDAKSAPKQVKGIPDGARMTDVSWSPNGKKIAFAVTTDTTITLWTIDVASGAAAKLIDAPLNHCYYYSAPYEWVSDGTIIANLIPLNRGAEPAKDLVPHAPIVQENDGQKRPARTQPDLLSSPYD